MTEDLHNIDKLFKSAIDGHEEVPPSANWKAIDKELDKSNIVSIKKKYADLKKLVVVLLLLLVGVIAYEWHSAYSSKTIAENIPAVNQGNTTNSNADNPSAIKQNTTLKKNTAIVIKSDQPNTVVIKQSDTINKDYVTVDKLSQPNRNNLTTNKRNKILTNNDAISKGSNIKDVNTASFNSDEEKNIPATVGLSVKNKPIHNPVKIQQKGKFFARITNGEAAESNSIEETATINSDNTVSNKISKHLNAAGLSGSLSRDTIAYSSIGNPAIQPSTLQNSILPGTTIKDRNTAVNNKPLSKPSHFSIIGFYSPSITSDLLDDDDDNNNRNNNGEDAAHIKRGEHQSSYSLGALLEYGLSKHWSLQSGFSFIQKVNRINPKTIYAQAAGNGDVGYLFNCSSGYSYLPSKSGNLSVGDSAQSSRSVNVLQYLSIPLLAKYTITKGKFSFNTSIGVSYNFLLKGTLETEVSNDTSIINETVNKIMGLRPGYISGIIGFGAEYAVTKKMAVCFNPSFNNAFTSITQNAPVKSYPSFFAFAAGLHIRL